MSHAGQVSSAVEKPEEGWVRTASTSFETIEHAAYVALGVLLAIAATLALAAACAVLWHNIIAWNGEQGILQLMDRLLFGLMLIEILHTVRASMRSGGLTCEPFLVVGLIATIRRILVITLQSSETTQNAMTPEGQALFRASMLELGVLALLIAVMVVAIWILHQAKPRPAE